ncbi:hypothetical protein [Thioalkalivibrio sp. ALMg3]|uniref:hypothetical protein n=1 Tax=Thioalkalivibrio sp. ALMg3 TaxID=1158163 RepID=UPI0012DE9038|nr:hypothetical protein [Thioalkalivibrio sp. ALMg3]
MFNDPIFRAPRVWSNKELKKFKSHFIGDIANISGWKDEDKEGGFYRAYFPNASSYTISNYSTESCGFQGDIENEIFLDLTAPVPSSLELRFDVVFNHTVLEHVFEVNSALDALCSLSKDIVVLVVPFLQEQHADYGDYWRFTPLCVERLLRERGFATIYINYNDNARTSVYVFAIASRRPERWKELGSMDGNRIREMATKYAGTNAIPRSRLTRVKRVLGRVFGF